MGVAPSGFPPANPPSDSNPCRCCRTQGFHLPATSGDVTVPDLPAASGIDISDGRLFRISCACLAGLSPGRCCAAPCDKSENLAICIVTGDSRRFAHALPTVGVPPDELTHRQPGAWLQTRAPAVQVPEGTHQPALPGWLSGLEFLQWTVWFRRHAALSGLPSAAAMTLSTSARFPQPSGPLSLIRIR